METGQGQKGWHSKLNPFCFCLEKGGKKEKKQETEAPVQHLHRAPVTLLAQANLSIWFSFDCAFCFAAVIFKYLSLNRLALGEGTQCEGEPENFKYSVLPASRSLHKIKYDTHKRALPAKVLVCCQVVLLTHVN